MENIEVIKSIELMGSDERKEIKNKIALELVSKGRKFSDVKFSQENGLSKDVVKYLVKEVRAEIKAKKVAKKRENYIKNNCVLTFEKGNRKISLKFNPSYTVVKGSTVLVWKSLDKNGTYVIYAGKDGMPIIQALASGNERTAIYRATQLDNNFSLVCGMLNGWMNGMNFSDLLSIVSSYKNYKETKLTISMSTTIAMLIPSKEENTQETNG